MLALEITNIKHLMNLLLKESVFNDFKVSKIMVDSFAHLEIEPTTGAEEGLQSYINWAELQPFVLTFIKNSKAPPKKMKFVLGKFPTDIEGIQNASTLFINITFEAGKMQLSSGISAKTFSMDKNDTNLWDNWILGFLSQNNIEYIRL